jgi:hypothetical protein
MLPAPSIELVASSRPVWFYPRKNFTEIATLPGI